MTRLQRYFPWLLALTWFVIRLITGKIIHPNNYESGRTVGVMTNLFFILAVIFIALIIAYRNRNDQPTTFLDDIKTSLKASLKYVLGVAILLMVYYGVVSNELELKRLHDFELITQSLDTPEEVQQAIAGNQMLVGMNAESIGAAMRKRITFFTDIRVIAPSALLVLSVVSIVYALLAVFLWRNFIRQR